MRELTVEAGRWWLMDGTAPDEDLEIQPIGPLLQAREPGCSVVTGYRQVDGERRWATVRVATDGGRR